MFRIVRYLIFCGLFFALLPELSAQNDKKAGEAPPETMQFRHRIPAENPYPTLPANPLPEKKEVIPPDEPNVHIETSDAIDHVMEIHRNKVQSTGNQGFRIQIYSGNNAGAGTARTQFVTVYDDVDTYTIFEQPIFKVRVGNFKTRKEADDFCAEVKVQFPAAFVVSDTIVTEPHEPEK